MFFQNENFLLKKTKNNVDFFFFHDLILYFVCVKPIENFSRKG